MRVPSLTSIATSLLLSTSALALPNAPPPPSPLGSREASGFASHPLSDPQIESFLTLFNRGDEAGLLQFIRANFSAAALAETPAEDQLTDILFRFVDTNGISPIGAVTSTPAETSFLATARITGFRYKVTLARDAKEPDKIASLSIAMQRMTEAERGPPLSPRQIAKEMDSFINRLAAQDAWSGSILITKDGVPVYAASRGFANRAYGARVNSETRFSVASIGKMFTSVAILQLIQQGRLHLSTKVGDILRDGHYPPAARNVTIEQLLTHRSGLEEIYTESYRQNRERIRAVRDYLPLIKDATLAFPPGTSWQYSNAGYILLGAIIEQITGEDFFAHVKRTVFIPAGMKTSEYVALDDDAPNIAIGYTQYVRKPSGQHFDFRLGPRTTNSVVGIVKGAPSGGAYLNPGDLTRFATALCTARLLNPTSLREMLSPHGDFGDRGSKEGLGVEIDREAGRLVLGHSGGDLGVASFLYIFPTSGYVIASVSNYDRGAMPAFKARSLVASVNDDGVGGSLRLCAI